MERKIKLTYEPLFEGEEKQIYLFQELDGMTKVIASFTPSEANELQINLESLLATVGKELNGRTKQNS